MKHTALVGIAVLCTPLAGCGLNPFGSLLDSKPQVQALAPAKQPDFLAGGGPTDIDGAIKVAQEARRNGEFATATRVLSQVMLVAPDDSRVLGEYGKTLAAQGRSDDALAFLERATQLQPNDWTLFSAQGVAYDQKGVYQAAQASYARALALKPGEPSVLNNNALSHLQSGDLDGAERLLRSAGPAVQSDPRIAKNLALVQNLRAAQAERVVPSPMTPPAPASVPASTSPVAQNSTSPVAQNPTPAALPRDVAPAAPPAPLPPAAEQVAAPLPSEPPVEAIALASPPPAIEQVAAPLPSERPVEAIALASPPPAPAPQELHPQEPAPNETPKTDPTVVMQPVPVEKPAPLPRRLPAKPDPAPTAEKKTAATTRVPAEAPAARPVGSKAFFVQAGAFGTEDRAGKAASGLESLGARVMPGNASDGHAVYRVRIGPFLNRQQANVAVGQAQELGHADLIIVTE